MKINFTPKSYLGKLPIGLIIMVPILFYIGMSFVSFYGSVPAGKTIPHDIIARPGVALSMLAGFFFAFLLFFVVLLALQKRKIILFGYLYLL